MGGEGGSAMATRDVHPPEVLRYVAMLLDPGRRDALLGHLGRTGS
ncbi:hypothetical protein CENSYa_0702 [Cenarchaeum symbiosum A]|uniref:Uncharacterized protein n=1 Tax=Cenarchaeum symbiosum (strain A) TaxID=414004 RepID=A0RVG8_CENSY|nr:hypothetical protein CENSYa_0702 [Cenarchaeum symbiosum A]